MNISDLILVVVGYCIGAIPTGAWICRAAGIEDITKHGSGNIGATNVGRMLGAHFFLIVLIIDVLKAFSFIYSMSKIYTHTLFIMLCAIALLIGNGYSLFFGGKGGKGVATSIGIMLALQTMVLWSCFCVWLLSFVSTRNVGIASVMSFLFLPLIGYYIFHCSEYIFLSWFICVWGLLRHRTNIKSFFAVNSF